MLERGVKGVLLVVSELVAGRISRAELRSGVERVVLPAIVDRNRTGKWM